MSRLVDHLLFYIKSSGLPDPVTEHRFHPIRRWRFDVAWLDIKVAVEVDGGTWVGGRHTTGSGFEADCHKMNEAACLGWIVIRCTSKMIEDGSAMEFIERAYYGRTKS